MADGIRRLKMTGFRHIGTKNIKHISVVKPAAMRIEAQKKRDRAYVRPIACILLDGKESKEFIRSVIKLLNMVPSRIIEDKREETKYDMAIGFNMARHVGDTQVKVIMEGIIKEGKGRAYIAPLKDNQIPPMNLGKESNEIMESLLKLFIEER